jgi:transcriptional regulator with XRE-family HTH domain
MDMRSEKPTGLAARIGAALRAIRKERGLTLKQIANHMQTTAQTVQRLETANMTMSLEWLDEYCRILHIPPAELFDDDVEDILSRRKSIGKARSDAKKLRIDALDFIGHVDEFLERTDG